LTAALQNNSQAVAQVLSGLGGTTSITPSSTNPWMATVSGVAGGQASSGTYKVTYNPVGNKLTSVFTSLTGGTSPATTSTIGAGGIDNLAIPGLTITALGVLPAVAGTDTINYAVTSHGVLQSLNDYINMARGPSGIFVSEHTGATSSIASFSTQIANQNALLAQQQTTLQAQFTAMEVALSKLQAQSASLTSSISSLNPTTSTSS
jgi:flagellar capping protein FliD